MYSPRLGAEPTTVSLVTIDGEPIKSLFDQNDLAFPPRYYHDLARKVEKVLGTDVVKAQPNFPKNSATIDLQVFDPNLSTGEMDRLLSVLGLKVREDAREKIEVTI